MLDQWERYVQFHDIYLKSEPEGADGFQLKEILPLLIERIKKNEAVKMINNDTAAIRITHVQEYIKDDAIIMLVQYSDENVTDPVFSNLQSGELRIEPKLEGEGVAVSAHIALSTVPHDPEGMFYRLLLEEIPGLGRSSISPFLKSEFKEVCKGRFDYVDVNDNQRTKNRRPSAEIVSTPSRQLSEEFDKGGILQSIELVKFLHNNHEFDEDGYYTESSRHIKLQPAQTPGDRIMDILNRVRKKARQDGYTDMKIRYKRPQGKTKTAAMGSTINDLQDALIVRDEPIRSDEQLTQCSEKIVSNFADKMVKLLKAD